MIVFNQPTVMGQEQKYLEAVLMQKSLCGDKTFTQRCHGWIEATTGTKKALLTTSCTHALEMAAILADIQAGDEIILPSYTFVSTANAFTLRGAKCIFVDVRPDTMNIDETKIEAAISPKTKVIVPVHYAGVSCEMDVIMDIAKRHKLLVIEDAAQGVTSTYKGKALGSIGHMGCYSFHETKNYTCGEGGALLINDPQFVERAEIIREKGTNRARFFRGQVDKYTWVDIGSSYLPSELNAAFLYAQLENADIILNDRMKTWNYYYQGLRCLQEQRQLELPGIPETCTHNGHMFYIKVRDLAERSALIDHLKEREIVSAFHYIPLHSSPAGKRYGVFAGEERYTTLESERLLRLPLYYGLKEDEVKAVIQSILQYYR